MKYQYKPFEFRAAVGEFAHKLFNSMSMPVSRMSVHWLDGITTAGVNSQGDMFLANIDDDQVVTHPTLVKYCGFIVHELCHFKWTDFSVRGNDQYLDQLHNAVEDAWIEHNAIASKLTGNVTDLLTTLVEGMTKEAISTVTDWSDPRQYPFMLAIYLRDHATTKTPMPKELKPIFDFARKRLNLSTNSQMNMDIAKWVYDQLQSLPKQSKNQSKDQSKDASKNDQKGSGSPDKGQGEGEGTPDPSSPSNEVGEATAPTPDMTAKSVEPSLGDDRYVDGYGISYSEDASIDTKGRNLEDDSIRNISCAASGKLRHEVKRLFDNSGREDWQRGRKSGTFNVSALHNVGSTDRLFKRRHETEGIDSAVVICLDVSGSMKNRRIDMAANACATLVDTLTKAGVATSIVAFSNDAYVLKDFNTPARKIFKDLERVKAYGGTNDYFAVRYAHTMLSKRTEQRKVCFVLSDGDGHIADTRHQCEVGERIGITTLGLGILHDVSNVYDKHINITDLADLGNATFKHIKLAV